MATRNWDSEREWEWEGLRTSEERLSDRWLDAIFLAEAPWACLYLNFQARIRGILVGCCCPAASELRVDGAESDTSHKFLLLSLFVR